MPDLYPENAVRYLQEPPLPEARPSLHGSEHPRQNVPAVPFPRGFSPRRESDLFPASVCVRHIPVRLSSSFSFHTQHLADSQKTQASAHIGRQSQTYGHDLLRKPNIADIFSAPCLLHGMAQFLLFRQTVYDLCNFIKTVLKSRRTHFQKKFRFIFFPDSFQKPFLSESFLKQSRISVLIGNCP